MKAIILARVSTKEQEEGHSLNAQKQRLVEYCQRRGFTVIKSFELIESSTRGERKEFQAMLEFAQKQKETIAIVADAVDRIQRSFTETVQLNEMRLKGTVELHFYREGMVISKNSNSSDIMRWDFAVLSAKSYVLQLSENVKRSMEYKRKNGEWTGASPIGYSNTRDLITGKATLEVDNERAFLVRRIFEEYATGLYSINEMVRRAAGWGLCNKRQKKLPLAPSQMHKLLMNPFYHGEMQVNGKLYPHRYTPIIDKDLFERCQDVRLAKNTRATSVVETKHDFVFRSLLTCAVSGRKVSPDIKKGKFIYLICRDPQNPEKKLFVPEQVVMAQVEEVFKALVIPQALIEAITEHLKKSHEAEKDYHHAALEDLKRQQRTMQDRLDRLLDMRIDGSITKDIYDTKASLLKQERISIDMAIQDHQAADDTYKITVSSVFTLASEAFEIFKSSTTSDSAGAARANNHQKRKLIGFLFSNLKLNGENLEYTLRSPFDLIVQNHSYEEWLGRKDSNPRWRYQKPLPYRLATPQYSKQK